MREFIKVVCVVVVIVALGAGAIAWDDNRPDETTRILKIVCPLAVVVALGLFFKIHFRPDIVPDYLRQRSKRFFNRDGLCFAFTTTVVDGQCHLVTFFQNQWDKPCQARIALRPAQGFFMSRGPIEQVDFEFQCEPAAFGAVTVPLPLPRLVQGRRQAFEVGASVTFPQGKGRQVRFRNGMVLETNSEFKGGGRSGLLVAAALMGHLAAIAHLAMPKAGKTKLSLPLGVADEAPADSRPRVATFWRLGDPPLNAALSASEAIG